MNTEKILVEKELKRTFEWLSNDPNALAGISYSYSNEASPKEIINTIDMLLNEKLYIPLTLYLSTDFISYRGAELIKRILIDVLLSLWSTDTLEIAANAMKKSIISHSANINRNME